MVEQILERVFSFSHSLRLQEIVLGYMDYGTGTDH